MPESLLFNLAEAHFRKGLLKKPISFLINLLVNMDIQQGRPMQG